MSSRRLCFYSYTKGTNHTLVLDTGIGDLIVDGHVSVKQGVELSHSEENAIVFSDGSKLEADVVVLCTGN